MILHPLVAVVGPTASGKSDLALALAESFGAEIVNCDSLQLYRYMDIGTAKTPPGLRRGIPHHLIDIIDPDQVFTAGEYQRAAREVLREIASRAARAAGRRRDRLLPERPHRRIVRRTGCGSRSSRPLGAASRAAAKRFCRNSIQILLREFTQTILRN